MDGKENESGSFCNETASAANQMEPGFVSKIQMEPGFGIFSAAAAAAAVATGSAASATAVAPIAVLLCELCGLLRRLSLCAVRSQQ